VTCKTDLRPSGCTALYRPCLTLSHPVLPHTTLHRPVPPCTAYPPLTPTFKYVDLPIALQYHSQVLWAGGWAQVLSHSSSHTAARPHDFEPTAFLVLQSECPECSEAARAPRASAPHNGGTPAVWHGLAHALAVVERRPGRSAVNWTHFCSPSLSVHAFAIHRSCLTRAST
jgi:hypothetical protein